MNSLQERVDLLVIKVTQLDSTVEEGEGLGLVWGDVQTRSRDQSPTMPEATPASLVLPVPPSFAAGHQHEESLQELHGAEPAGGVPQLHPQPSDGDVPALRQTPAPQHPHTLQVRAQLSLGLQGGPSHEEDQVCPHWCAVLPPHCVGGLGCVHSLQVVAAVLDVSVVGQQLMVMVIPKSLRNRGSSPMAGNPPSAL